MRTALIKARRLVIKVGSALVTNNGAGLDKAAMEDWARQIAVLRTQGRQIALVSSGAIAAGMQRLGWQRRPHEMHKLQAAAAVGQMGLVEAYEEAFSRHGLHTAQILLTHDDLADRKRYLNARSTLHTLLGMGVVPIINENDTIVTDEIKFGDNDTLGALVANLLEADALIILTDQQGLYTADPRKDAAATLISEGKAEDPSHETIAGGAGSGIGKGGMLTKVRAAQRAARSGAHTCIASGRDPDICIRLVAGEPLGTLLYATSTPLPRAMVEVVDPDEPDRLVEYGATGRVRLTTLTKEFFMPRFLERDEAEREPPCDLYPWDGVRNVRPFSKLQANVVEGVY
jgi:glutamate 5-kinase